MNFYYKNNKEKILKQQKEYYDKNKEHKKEKQKIYYQQNREKIRILQKEWYKENKCKAKEYYVCHKKEIRKYEREKRQIDINFKLAFNIRKRLSLAIRRNQKVGSAVKDLGCSIQELKKYIEQKFTDGMSWGNYGEWHIDHIKPLSKFNLSDRQEFLEACNYENLQPLWAKENIAKGNK